MSRFFWKRTLAAVFACAGFAAVPWAPAKPPAPHSAHQVILIKEEGKPEQPCVVEHSTRMPDGTLRHRVRVLATGEVLEVLDYRQKQSAKAAPAPKPAAPAAQVHSTLPRPEYVSAPVKVSPPPIPVVRPSAARRGDDLPRAAERAHDPLFEPPTWVKERFLAPAAEASRAPAPAPAAEKPAERGLLGRLFGRQDAPRQQTAPDGDDCLTCAPVKLPAPTKAAPPRALAARPAATAAPKPAPPKGRSLQKETQDRRVARDEPTIRQRVGRWLGSDAKSDEAAAPAGGDAAARLATLPSAPRPLVPPQPAAAPAAESPYHTTLKPADEPAGAPAEMPAVTVPVAPRPARVAPAPAVKAPPPAKAMTARVAPRPATPAAASPAVRPAQAAEPVTAARPGTPEYHMARLRDALRPSAREDAALALASARRPMPLATVAALIRAVEHDPAPSVRACCIRCLSAAGVREPKFLALLEGLQESPDPQVSEEARHALAKLAAATE
ncbi:MAG TPA: HEAT repeat domain-containing protein [Gemmataceae bacterium]